ncbi:DUF5675 family protein [uncultured Winogradskyella sp.]|uniref:DUF5675 family protein n=1 Tax=uncultured Winogradskyella sp. TaxID=395353 RepID=UPI0030EB7500|tara:strand:- start:163 stop:600 length:438 start_codon:yes stop_codon:yes gene_type:complete
MKTIVLFRDDQYEENKVQSLGTFAVFDEDKKMLFKCESLERGWLDNQRMISCVPEGEYPMVLEYSNRFKKDLWELKEVPNRSECKIHAANYSRQLNGCIALGSFRVDIDGDGNKDVTNSRKAIKQFHEIMGDDTESRIIITTLTL